MIEGKRPIFFMHIPKTAGTSLRLTLSQGFKQSEIFPNDKFIEKHKGYPKIDELKKYKERINNSQLFYGHYPLRYVRNNYPQYSVITFLRDPIERTISHLKHIKTYNAEFQNFTLDEIFEIPMYNKTQFDNLQTRYLLPSLVNENLDFKQLKEAKKNLKSIDFIGIKEQYNNSIQKLQNKFSLNFNETLEENTTKLDTQISTELIMKIYKKNSYDIELYNLGCHLANKK